MHVKAFTLIELIVVTSIMILLSTTGVFYFSNFIQTNEINQDIAAFEDDLKTLKSDIHKHNLLDYQINFDVDSLAYIIYKNIYFQDNTLSFSWDEDTSNGSVYFLKKQPLPILSGNVRLYEGDIKKQELNFTATGKTLVYSGVFDHVSKILIQGNVGDVALNDIIISYFAEKNLDNAAGDFFKLIAINSKIDKTGKSYTHLEIKNIGGKQIFSDNLDEIYLFFEDKGIERSVKISQKE